MKYENIGSRLLMAASLVCNGKTVCDVGCDHGKLSLYLVKSGRAERVIATDINKMPLQKAIDLFSENGISDKAEFHLTDGLQNITETDDGKLTKIYHQTVKKVTSDFEQLGFNTAIAQMMVFVNEVYKNGTCPREYAEGFIKMLSCITPHVGEEIWQILGLSLIHI